MPVKRYDGSNWVTVAGEGVQGPTGPAGASATTVVTTKGDLLTYDTTAARLGVGANDTVLTADSSTATGLKWATPSAGGMTLLSTTTLTGSTVTVSSISSAYKNLFITIRNYLPSVDGGSIRIRVNGDTGTRYANQTIAGGINAFTDTFWQGTNNTDNVTAQNFTCINLFDYAQTGTWKTGQMFSWGNYSTTPTSVENYSQAYCYNQTGSAISSITFFTGSGTHTSGTVSIFGVN